MAEIVIINPRFDVSSWGMEHAMPLIGRRANVPVASLPLLAALTPAGHDVTLIDETVRPIDFDRVARADIAGVTGMIVQRLRMKEIVAELKRRGVFTVVGGPLVTVQEDYLRDLADVTFVGEAEETWPRFLAEWAEGRHAARYEQSVRSDMSRVPTPRFDKLEMRHYAFGSLQITRGCPFQCEFCDVIATLGRTPRVKTGAQVLAELDALKREGVAITFLADDNLAGGRKAIKPVLADVARWQERHGYPMTLFTQASLDVADDPELMGLMSDANVIAVYVGIETPNEASLRETRKFQNVRAGEAIVERVGRIHEAGMDVWAGMILGFDHDDETIFDAHLEFLARARIANSVTLKLYAVPKTPLYERLAREGRLDPAHELEYGTNVVPLRMGREQLRDGHLRLMSQLYAPEAYFARVDALLLDRRFQMARGRSRYWKRHPLSGLRWEAVWAAQSLGLYWRLMTGVPEAHLRREYRRRFWNLLRKRRDPGLGLYYLLMAAFHYHAHSMARQMASGRSPIFNV